MGTIQDMVSEYARSGTSRFHMPGHKGRPVLGPEERDITEIKGADSLFGACGIIAQSEARTALVFGSGRTLYSAEGSSLCIRTMLGLIRRTGGRRVLAPRNVHKAFIDGCILLDMEPEWLYPATPSRSVCASDVGPEDIRRALETCTPDCVYITSPDYLGNLADIAGIARVCHEHGVPLLVDNAHGAYLRFLKEDMHPLTLGADMCCDSAHKTLPCLTGGAYLHLSRSAAEKYGSIARETMAMFASTSPSYLLLQSLDACADLLNGDFPQMLRLTAERTAACKQRLLDLGWTLAGREPCKITINANARGLSGEDLADQLRAHSIEPEYADCTYVVLMTAPGNTEEDFRRLEQAMSQIEPGSTAPPRTLPLPRGKRLLSMREAALSISERIPTEKALGRTCALSAAGCQPAVPIAVPGEEITGEIMEILKLYDIEEVSVIRMP